MEMNDRFLTLLTPEGQFLKVNRLQEHYEIGQEIAIPVQVEKKVRFPSFFNTLKGKSVAALAVACMMLLTLLTPSNKDEVYAYMSIDINPSIEIGVNEDLKVIEITPYNKSGEEIVQNLKEWKRKDLKEVTKNLLLEVEENGYLNNNQEVIIGTVHTGEVIKKSDVKLDEAVAIIKDTVTKEDATFLTIEPTKNERDEAKEKGKTAGSLFVEKQSTDNSKEKSEQKKTPNNEKVIENPPATKQNQNKVEKKPDEKIQPNGEKSTVPNKSNNSGNGKQAGKDKTTDKPVKTTTNNSKDSNNQKNNNQGKNNQVQKEKTKNGPENSNSDKNTKKSKEEK